MLPYSSGNSQQHHTYFFILLTAIMKKKKYISQKSSYRPTTDCIETYEKLAAETKNTTWVVIPTKLQDIKQPPTSLNFNPDICAICSCNNIGASSVTTDLLQPLWRSPFTSLLYGKSGIVFIKCLRVRNEPKLPKQKSLQMPRPSMKIAICRVWEKAYQSILQLGPNGMPQMAKM